MLNEGIDGGKDAVFDRRRFVGVAGREALHVFDLKQELFVSADRSQGYARIQPPYGL